jgi:tetratricopeptide (TPR) repeat protein
MANRWDFQYSVKKPPEGGVVELSKDELERHLLNRLEQQKDKPDEALADLARFYGDFGQIDKALSYWRQVLESKTDMEAKAACVLAMGATMEKANNYEAAVRFYKEAFALEPVNTNTWYWINNNLGFSLNTLGRFKEGEVYCRQAIQIDFNRPNGHKNLGISLDGQGMFTEAARCFINATRVNAADARSLKHLEDLVAQHPQLEVDLGEELEFCRKAVGVAAKAVAAAQPVVHRGWKKRFFLWRMRFRTWLARLGIRRKE